MALSFRAVQKAYDVFHELKRSHLPDLKISSFPQDIGTWNSELARKNPDTLKVYGWGSKSDSGWENLFFLVHDPSEDLKQEFDRLKSRVPNTSFSGPYSLNPAYWSVGWF